MEQMSYKAPNLALDGLVEAISKWFETGGFETQTLKSPDGGFMVQARQTGRLRSLLGMASALSMKLVQMGDDLQVDVGAAKWSENASMGAAAAAGTLVAIGLWPAFATAAYGSWKQSQLPAQAFKAVEEYIKEGRISVSTTPLQQTDLLDKLPFTMKPKVLCPSCGQSINEKSKFCNHCGTNLRLVCKCGASLRAGAKFCDNCGSPIAKG